MIPTEPLAYMIRHSGGVQVAFGGASTYAHLDRADEDVAEMLKVRTQVWTLSFPAADLPGVRKGSVLTLSGSLPPEFEPGTYRVAGYPDTRDDGRLQAVHLVRV